jgi:RNA polymerase sigma-70 factor (ECF subfamily)
MLHWLTVIMRNVALDMLRARARRPAVVDTDLLDVVAAPAFGAGEIDAMLVRTVLRRALTGIGRHHRNAIEQTILLDRPYDTVAAELGVPVGTLRSRVHHGLRRLRTILETAEDASPTPCAA